MTAAPVVRAGPDVVQRVAEAALQVRPVRQPGERVVQGLVAQLADQLAVAQRDAGLVGDGLQQEHVVLHEGPDVALPVGHDERRRRRRSPPVRGTATASRMP